MNFLLQFGGTFATAASAHDDLVFGIHGAHGRDLSWDEDRATMGGSPDPDLRFSNCETDEMGVWVRLVEVSFLIQ